MIVPNFNVYLVVKNTKKYFFLLHDLYMFIRVYIAV